MSESVITDEDREQIFQFLKTPYRDRSPDDLLPDDDDAGEGSSLD